MEAPIRLQLIEWDDAAGAPDHLGETWPSFADIRKHVRLHRIISVGWVVQEDKVQIVLVPNRTKDRCGADGTAIPKATIVRRVTIKVPAS